jgi:2'-5' RNA ligase
VIWTGFEEVSLFESMREMVDAALATCGIARDSQSFRAHLTLGRIRSVKDLKGFYHLLEQMRDRFSETVMVDRLVFFRSELGAGPPVYTPLHRILFL